MSVSDSESREFPYWRRNLRVIPPANLLASLAFGLSWPFLPLMVRGLGVEARLETWVGNMVLAFYVVSFVMNPIWGGIADHYGRKIMVLRAMLGMGSFMTIAAFATTPFWFAFLLCCVRFFNGSSAAGMALIVGNTPPSRIGRALALAQTGMLVGQTTGPALGALLATHVPHYALAVLDQRRDDADGWHSGRAVRARGEAARAGPVAPAVAGSVARAPEGAARGARLFSRFSVRGPVERQRHRDEPLHAAILSAAGASAGDRGDLDRRGRARARHRRPGGDPGLGLGARSPRSRARARHRPRRGGDHARAAAVSSDAAASRHRPGGSSG